MDDKESKAASIRERFKNRGNGQTPEKTIIEDTKLDTIIEKAKEREQFYSEVGQERATQNKKENEKEEKTKIQYRQTTLRILLRDLGRFKRLEALCLSENALLTYEKVFLAGLDSLEKMDDAELISYINQRKNDIMK